MEVGLKLVPAMRVAALEVKGPFSRMEEVVREIFIQLEKTGGEAEGPPMAVFYDEPDQFDPQNSHYEVCVPVGEGFASGQSVRAKELPSAEVAFVVHIGPYRKIHPAYQEIGRWISENGYHVVGPYREVYLIGPWSEEAQGPGSYRTEIQFPMARKEPSLPL